MTQPPGAAPRDIEMASCFINGERVDTVDYMDRGLSYGDGLFETLLVRSGVPMHWRRHRARLQWGLERLGIAFDDFEALQSEVFELASQLGLGVMKVLITRGIGARGYAPLPGRRPTRIVSLHGTPDIPASYYRDGVTLRWCETRLAVNPRLAGIKHLNRLEQVLARSEWSDTTIAEGLMRDTDGRVVSGTSSNLFLLQHGHLITPRVDRCGVAGVARAVIMAQAKIWSIPVREIDISPRDVNGADALFVSNSVIGIWPVARLLDDAGGERRFPIDPLSRHLMQAMYVVS